MLQLQSYIAVVAVLPQRRIPVPISFQKGSIQTRLTQYI